MILNWIRSFLSLRVVAWLVGLILCGGTTNSAIEAKTENYDTLRLPVRVYALSFEAAPDLNSSYRNRQIAELFAEVNEVWRQWGIEWVPKPIMPLTISKEYYAGISSSETPRSFRNKLAAAIGAVPQGAGWQVAILHRFPFPAGGVYVPEKKTVFYGELNKNGARHPVILAHELGHALGLRHTEDKNNLMYGGVSKDPTITKNLDMVQIQQARAQALIGPFQPAAGSSTMGPMPKPATVHGPAGPHTMRRNQIVRRLQSFDRNGDGNITLDEVPARAQEAFEHIDRDGNGSLNQNELDRFLRR